MPGIDTSMYAPVAQQQPNLLGMTAQFAGAQNALNQNALFQQTFRARQALGPLAQQSIGPDGQMDYNKFSVLISSHPDTAWMAPDIINGIVQRQLLQSETVAKNLDIAKTKSGALANYAGAAVANNPNGSLPQNEVMGVAAQIHALHLDGGGDPKDVLSWAATIGHPPGKDGQPDYSTPYDPKLAHKQLTQFQIAQQTAKDTLDATHSAYNEKFGGGARVGTQNVYTGQQTPITGPGVQPGGVVPETAAPGVPQINPVTGAKGQTLVGQPLPPTGGRGVAPGIESIIGGGTGTPGASTPPVGGPGGPVAPTALGPVQAERLKAMAPYTKETNDQGTKSLQMNQILDEMDRARSKFKTGGGMDGYIGVAKALQALGLKDETVDRVAGGNLGAAQEYSKLQAQLAAAVLKNALMPGAGRILDSEYRTFTKANANWDTDPRAIDKMFSFMRTQNGINIQRMNYLNAISQAANKGEALPKGMSDLSDFEPWYNKKLIQHGVIGAATQKLVGGATTSDPLNVATPPPRAP